MRVGGEVTDRMRVEVGEGRGESKEREEVGRVKGKEKWVGRVGN